MSRYLVLGFLAFLFLLKSASCSNGGTKVTDSAYISSLLTERAMKDNDFATNPKSPFAMLTGDFEGLKYFAPDPSWNVEVSWTISDTVYSVKIADTKGGLRDYGYAGNITFTRGGKSYTLRIWHEEEDSSALFIMFKDRTSGKETYGGGRYIEMPAALLAGAKKVDFNRAFNPFCHYNHDYSCPVVPKECFLDLEIKAGEKLYK